jgi:hypothetical protein
MFLPSPFALAGRGVGVNALLRQGLVIVLVLVAGLAAFFGARAWQAHRGGYAVPPQAVGCQLLDGRCRQQLAQGAIELEVDPPAIPLMQTLTLTVQAENLSADAVSVDIRGLNMDMGLNLTRLRQVADDRWEGETILPVCSQRRMEWEARVQVDGAQRLAVPFLFFTERP